jgi:hypothetical protein
VPAPRGLLVAALGASALGCATGQGGQPVQWARTAGVTIGAGATYGNLTGGDFTGSKAAVGFDANAGVVLGRWQLGVGYDRTNHRHETTNGDYVVSNVYVEPRLLFGSRRVTPYGAVRLGRAMASYQGVLGITDKATGYIAGVGAGVVLPIAGLFQADVAAHYDRLSHDYGTGGYADAERGGRASVRLGVRVAGRR